MSQGHDHIIESFDPWRKIANKSLGLFVKNVETDQCMGSIFRNHFHFLLIGTGGWIQSECMHRKCINQSPKLAAVSPLTTLLPYCC